MSSFNILSNENMELYSSEYPYNLSLRVTGFEDEKTHLKFVKNCERMVRSSIEYREWRKYIRDVVQNNYCLITLEVDDQVTVEIHHHIPSLFTITKTIVNKFINQKKEFCSFDVCLEIMKIHFLNKIGYIPLIKSMHEKFHSGYLKIPINLVKGDYKSFLREYGQYIDDEDWDLIKERENVTIPNNTWKKDEYPGLNYYDGIENVDHKMTI